MRDSEVAAAIVAGDPAGLAEAYDRYADPLYRFCRTMLHEPADAADAVHDTFVIAACRLSGLEDRERLRSWLYAVARNECRRRLRGDSRQAPLETAAGMADEAADVAAAAEKAELRALVHDALSGLGSTEREVLELQLRHGLANSEAASILGISRNHLHALLSRARDQLETSLGVLVLARAGRQDCPVLDSMLEGWDDRLTILLRKRVNQHVRRCVVCSERWQREMTPAMLLGVTPIVALPLAAALSPGVRDLVMRAATGNSPAAVAHRAALARTASAFSSRGFPRPLAPPRAHWRRLRPAHAGALTGTAAAAASVVTVVTVVALPPHHAAPPPRGAAIVAGPTASGPSTVGHAASWPPSDVPAASGTGGTERVSAATTGDSASPSATAVTSTSAPASATVSATSASGTLSVRPATLDITPSATGTITLTASGGPVDWSVSEPPGLTKKVVVSPMSGTLAAGATSTVSVAVDGPGKMHVHLAFSPGGTTVTVVVS
jgi:RNA polymerase sigma factor (sigma-70 family)